ncbi:Sir2 family NAD-dependent protein deacetylase [Pedobacter sp. GR22-6]|uniref:Sir2 family NAD-dependent protein deacetylase n=1 Tax=Pedobacter sp. GR22-6 TaxID=3127957 RepID=UPI00307F1B73
MKNIVVLSGAGISAESGIKTFRDADGLWEGHRIEDVATPEAWKRNPILVQQFYNERRKAVLAAVPNAAHLALAALQSHFIVHIITQNVDNLHERAGSKNVLHLHGIITKAQSDLDSSLTYPVNGWELSFEEKCKYGQPLRPHIVWFGEEVPNMVPAVALCKKADIFAVIGTSLQVYPAAGLVQYVPKTAIKYVIDKKIPEISGGNILKIEEPATIGVPMMAEELINNIAV